MYRRLGGRLGVCMCLSACLCVCIFLGVLLKKRRRLCRCEGVFLFYGIVFVGGVFVVGSGLEV